MARLALFPLQLVLFPGLSLDLQIFERRYLRLVAHCMKSDEPFGIVGISEGQEAGGQARFHHQGTSARITDWRQQENGLLGISLKGERRFRVTGTETDPDRLMWADVEWMPEEPPVAVGEHFQGLRELLIDLAQHPGAAPFRLQPETRDASDLGFQLAQVLPLSDVQKLQLLEMHNPVERLATLSGWIEKLSQR